MPKFVLSDIAPKDQKKFTLGADEVEVPFETDDPVLAANAASHPWLVAEADKEQNEQPPSYVKYLAPEDDVLSSVNSIANDPDEVAKALAEREDVLVSRTAFDAELDQSKKVEAAGVAVTEAAAEDADPEPSRKLQPTKGPTAAKGSKE